MSPRDKTVRPDRRDELPLVPVVDRTGPREIDVHIEELVLHGFDSRSRWSIADALETELRTLLSQRGAPPAWLSNPDRIDAGVVPSTSLTNPRAAGQEVARAVHKGGDK